MIRLEKKDAAVVVKLEVNVPWSEGIWTWSTSIDFGSRWVAAFWIEAFTKQLGERLRSIRQKAYDRGWADAKAKRGKAQQWFTTINDV